jgi:hypothetical protein
VINNASTTAFAVYDNGNATYSGSIFQSSDQRLKTDVTPLDASSSLAEIEGLSPVSYTRIDQPGQGTNLGFIAQAVQQIFPELVSTTSPTALTPDGTLTLNYVGLISPMVKAIQALAAEVNGFAQSITSAVGNFDTVNTNQLCVGSTCVDEAQLQELLQQAGQQTDVPTDSDTDNSDSLEATSTDDSAANSTDSSGADASSTLDAPPGPTATSTDSTTSPQADQSNR